MSEIRIKSQGAIKLFESDNTSHVTIASPSSLSANRTITIPDADVNLTNVNSIPTLRPNAKPLIINGDMQVAQRATSATGLTSSGYNTVDRFKTNISGLGTWTETQESLTSGNSYTDGFSNALKIDCTTADVSPSASDRLYWTYRFEGQDVQLLKKGTTNAEKVTVSFWIKATKTGTNILELYDNDNSRDISASYTISSSNTWEHKVVSFPADTSGVLGDDNGSSFFIIWALGAGSNYTSGTLNTSWANNTNANRYVGQVNHGDSTSNNVHITGVQMEVGEYTSATLPPFQHESFGNNLARCQRYFQEIMSGESQNALCNLVSYTSGTLRGTYILPTQMRANPTQTDGAALADFLILGENTSFAPTALAAESLTKKSFVVTASCSSSTQGSVYWCRGDAEATYTLDSEL